MRKSTDCRLTAHEPPPDAPAAVLRFAENFSHTMGPGFPGGRVFFTQRRHILCRHFLFFGVKRKAL